MLDGHLHHSPPLALHSQLNPNLFLYLTQNPPTHPCLYYAPTTSSLANYKYYWIHIYSLPSFKDETWLDNSFVAYFIQHGICKNVTWHVKMSYMPFSQMRGNFCQLQFFSKVQVHSPRQESKLAVESIYISHLKMMFSQILCYSQISMFIMHGKINPLVCM